MVFFLTISNNIKAKILLSVSFLIQYFMPYCKTCISTFKTLESSLDCLFGLLRPTREFFTHMETSPLPLKVFKSLTYARHSWPLSSEGSLACHTYYDKGHPFTMVISEHPYTHTCYRAFVSGAVTTCFTTKVCRGWDSNTSVMWIVCITFKHTGVWKFKKNH